MILRLCSCLGIVPTGIAVIKMDSFPDVSLDVSFHRIE